MFKALALDNFWAPAFARSKHKTVNKETSGTWRFYLAVGLIAANAVLLMSYIYGVNDYASQGYQLTGLQNQLSSLTDQNRQITLQVSEASSMVSIQNDFLSANFVPAGTPTFLQNNPLLSQR